MPQPKLKIKRESTDWIIELIGFIGAILLIGLPIIHYNDLPESIPTHFGLTGQPDKFSSKEMIWTLPAIGLFIFIGMSILNKYPHIFNYPKEITQQNIHRQYKMATRLIRLLNTLIIYVFFYLTYASIQIAFGEQSGLSSYFVVFLLIGIFGPIGIYIYRSCIEK